MDISKLREITLSMQKEIDNYYSKLLSLNLTKEQRAILEYEHAKLLNNMKLVLDITKE
jgi:hypothetical protein